MRKALIWLTPVSLFALAACSGEAAHDEAAFTEPPTEAAANAETARDSIAQASNSGAEAPNSVAEARAPSSADSELAALSDRPDIAFTLPKMAYAFDLGFRLAGEDIVALQQEHADMCEAFGPYNCQIVQLTSSGEVDEDIHGELQLAVAADKARGFARMLSGAATEAGAESFKANIQGEELSKTIVDTEARLRSRIALRDRLLGVLETRRGKVEELVEAERSVAAVNEEIDAAQSWLREQKGRVAFSRMTISYETATPGGSFLAPINSVVGSLGSIFGVLIAILILVGAIVGPLLAAIFGIRHVTRRMNREPSEA